jgi:hypothetical protein
MYGATVPAFYYRMIIASARPVAGLFVFRAFKKTIQRMEDRAPAEANLTSR